MPGKKNAVSTKTTAKRKTKKRIAKRKRKAKRRTARRASSRVERPYPRATLEEALRVPAALKEKNGGNPWPPEDVAAALGLSPKSYDFFYMAGSSRDFGLTEGSRDTKEISLTAAGRELVYAPSPKTEEELKRKAFLSVDIFKRVLDYYKGSDLPEMKYLSNTLTNEFGLHPDTHEEFSRLFREICEYLSIGSGIPTPLARDTHRAGSTDGREADHPPGVVTLAEPERDTGLHCFVVMPFTERDEEHRKGFSTRCFGV